MNTEHPLDMLLRRVREGLNDPAIRSAPEDSMALELTRRDWKEVRDALVQRQVTAR